MPLTEEQKTNLKVFEICGVEYVYRNKQCKATCPLCDKRNHFYIDPETTKWDCKSCGERGNNYSFLTDYVNRSSAGCSQRELRTLRRLRNNFVPSATLKRHGLFQNHNGEWCLPIRNRKGTVTNLKRWNPRENTFFGLPGMGVGLFNIHNLKKKGPIFVCEGEWDAIALDWLLRACKIKDFTVVGLPGAAAFKESWGIFFGGREVYLCFDNDKPGQDGLDRTAQILSARKRPPSKMYRLVWPDGLKVGYDVRDFVTEGRKRPNDSLKEFQGRFIEVELENASEPAREPLERNTFEEVIADFKKVYNVTQEMQDSILICMAAIATTPMRRDPIWVMLVGPAGCLSGETMIGVNRGGKGFQISVEKLHYMFHGGVRGGKSWRKDIPTRVQYRCEETGSIRLINLNDVVYSGEKEVFELTTSSGNTIKATVDHRFYTDNGWKRLHELTTGDMVWCRKNHQKNDSRIPKVRHKQVTGCKYHPHCTKTKSYSYEVPEHRLVVEASMNGLPFDEYVQVLKTDSEQSKLFKFIDRKLHVHHIDHDPFNNTLSNLEVLTAKEHLSLHAREGGMNHVLFGSELQDIVSIESCGVEPTYDLCVDDPHNFVANNFVVHNSGKTTVIDAFQWCTHVADHHSTLTATTMVSGYKVPNGEGGYEDKSLINHIDGMTLFIKDLTAILSKPSTVQDEFFGLIRDIYDGHYKHQFGNGKTIEVSDVNFSIVAGVTPEIHKTNRTALGERFIKFNITPPDFDPEDNIRAALRNVSVAKEATDLVCASVLGFVNTFDLDPTNPPHCPEWFEENLVALTQIVAYLRAHVHKKDDVLYRQEPEVAARLGKILKKLGQGIAYVLKKDQVDKECYRVVKIAALNSCMGIPLEVMGMLMRKEYRYGVKATYIADKLQLSETQVKNVLRAFQELGAATYQKSANNSGSRGRDVYLWRPSVRFKDLWKRCGLGRVQPPRTPSDRTKRSRVRG